MKRNKKLLLMLAVMAVCIAAAVIITGMDFNSPEQEEADNSFVIFQSDPDSVTDISWTYEKKTMSFRKTGDGWCYTEDAAFAVDADQLQLVLAAAKEIKATKTLSGIQQLADYGLAEPQCSVTVTANGVSKQILFGNKTGIRGSVYVSIGDGNVYLVEEKVPEGFAHGLYDMLLEEEIPEISDILQLNITTQAQELEICHKQDSGLTYSDTYVWFLDGKVLDTELTEELMSKMKKLTWDSCVNFKADAQSLESYGLAEPVAVISVTYRDAGGKDQVFTLEVGNMLEDKLLCYSRIQGSSMVYLVDGNIRNAMVGAELGKLLPDEVIAMDFDTLTALDMILDGETYHVEITKETVTGEDGKTSQQTVYTLDGKKVDLTAVLESIGKLAATDYATGLVPELQEEIRFVFYREHETYPQVILAFYRYDSENCITQLLGESTVLVKRSKIVDLVEDVNAVILADSAG